MFLWRFGDARARAAFVPLTGPLGGGGGGGAAGAPGTGGAGRRQLLLELLQSPHWDGAVGGASIYLSSILSYLSISIYRR